MTLVVLLVCLAAVAGLTGCGYGPISQSYAIESGAEPVSFAIGEGQDVELKQLVKDMRTAKLNLADQLTNGSPRLVLNSASNVILLAREMADYQPAIALGTPEDAALIKRLPNDVQELALESARAADAGNLGLADRRYAQMYLKYNEWYRKMMGTAMAPVEPLEIPEIEEIQASRPETDVTATPVPPVVPEAEAPAAEAPAPVDDAAEREARNKALQALMKRMRTASLQLNDLLTHGTRQQVIAAAVNASLRAKEISAFEYKAQLPAEATDQQIEEARQEERTFRNMMTDVQGAAVQVARSAELNNMREADGHYVQMFMGYNQWKRFFATPPPPPPEEMTIPELRGPEGESTTPAPAPPETTP
jgi:hypothetical protein